MQWWVKVETLAKAAGDAVRNGDTVIHPASQEPRWFDWVDNMHDWCISRQLWWGHRIPIWYGPEGEVVCVGPDETAPEGWVQDPDVLDTWFSSGLWPFSTMGWPDDTAELEKFYPTSVLVTGYDILFFWVARMMMFGTFVAEDAGADRRQVRRAGAVQGRVPARPGPRPVRQEDVEVARQRHRPAGLGRRLRRRCPALHPGPRRQPRQRPVRRRGRTRWPRATSRPSCSTRPSSR